MVALSNYLKKIKSETFLRDFSGGDFLEMVVCIYEWGSVCAG